ncbi:alpha-glucan family phosphorylase [Paenibacillus sp. LMG 31456]|uniref:Alpha-glucan family phosphorylase n=1 Tax=Paenibacillus foliorum TaxID=2654974 RepID=A0A972H3X2_9BACL|nr:alpha-glucan family phosphorylase [Paenibacillus foliorum]NOU95806.1 alpha-glucan family phosphorylase [Paenibacillus foliorum]
MTTMFSYRNMKLPQTIERLPELAYNMWFSWNDDALELFSKINRELWDQFLHNPVRMLAETHPDVWEPLSKDTAFVKQYEKVIQQWDEYCSGTTWFQRTYPEFLNHQIAYFSAEFGFHESLPIYSGGLGVLAGDHCKSASDLGIPLVGIGLLYKKGYFNQKINKEGQQLAEAVSYDFSKLPILPALDGQGQELIVPIQLADRTVQLKIWQVQVGLVSLYLMDADIEGNSQWDRDLTAQLYGGNQDIRIAQEILLGMGGVKALRALGVTTAVYHINEGHAAFQAFERIKEQLDAGLPFHIAVEVIRASSVFTTHTPVPAGHDAFPMPMVEHYCSALLSRWGEHKQAWTQLGLDPSKQLFNMTNLALNTSALRNGVSKLHGQVSREMFRSFHGNIAANEVPIAHITNGVHMNTWLAPELKELYNRFLPGTWATNQTNEDAWKLLDIIPVESLWEVHTHLKEKLIRYVRSNLREHRCRNDMPADKVEEVRSYLSAKALTIGFARRFATYKRANLVFNDLNRLDRLVNSTDRPVQFLFAGKAHPADLPGQEMIREIYRISQMDRFRGKIVLLENYDMNMARYLVQGVDVWLNNPRRPYEASGTSGQKAAMNGVINFSVLDGWWEEGYDGTNGWSIEGNSGADGDIQARENTESIYRLLEQEIVPLYYNQGKLPAQWVSRMKRSIGTLAPVYNTDRMVMEYTNTTYIPTIKRTMSLVANQYDLATKVADYKNFIKANWHFVKFLEVNDGSVKRPLNSTDRIPELSQLTKEITSTLKFGPIWYKDTVVELLYYVEQPNHQWQQVTVTMNAVKELDNRVVQYSATVPAHLRHGSHFSLRVRPVSPNFATSFEMPIVTTF